MIGPFKKAQGGYTHVLVAIDKFTKWIEAASFANVTKTAACRFLKKEIICRYGLLKESFQIMP